MNNLYRTGNKKMDKLIGQQLLKEPPSPHRMLTAADYLLAEKRNKYGVSSPGKRTYKGITFDSKHEMEEYQLLELRQRAKEIEELECQVHFNLQGGFMHQQLGTIKPIAYVADFVYRELTGEFAGKTVIVDAKGVRTPEYQLKRKLFLYRYPAYIFLEV